MKRTAIGIAVLGGVMGLAGAAWAGTAAGSLRVGLQVVDTCRVRAEAERPPSQSSDEKPSLVRTPVKVECEARSSYKVTEEQTVERDAPVRRRIVTY